MSKTALYQKYRSSTFDEVIGQEYIVRSIRNAVRQSKIGHAYLFCGPRGTGKTTMARLLAKSVNCLNPENAPCEGCEQCIAANNGTHPDIVEINAANETHVEDIRDLIERSRLAPMMGKHKIYIIDEVHQLSSAASSALLKTLEEPPEHVIFILATTDPQKLLPTIISRCQRYDFSRVNQTQIKDHLLNIAQKEKIEMEEKAAEMIAVLSEGGMRDALSIMDQCAAYTSDHITEKAIENIYGLTTSEEKTEFIKNMLACNIEELLKRIQTYDEKGIDLSRFTDGLIDILKDCVVYAYTGKAEIMKILDKESADSILGITGRDSCMRLTEKFIRAKENYKNASSLTSAFEVACLSAAVSGGDPEKNTLQPVILKQPQKTAEGPVQKENKEEKTEVKPEIKPEIKEPNKMSKTDVVSLLIQCDKASKLQDETIFANMDLMSGAEERKYTTLLKQTKISASGKDCIILVTGTGAIANRINDEEMNKELYFFIKDKLGVDKMIYAITEELMKESTIEFVKLRKENSLPQKKEIIRFVTEEKQEKTPEEKVIALFGKENVEIVGG